MPSNAWRYTKFKPGKAHLWALTQGGLWLSWFGRMFVANLEDTTVSLPVETGRIVHCKQCLAAVRRKKAA